MLLVIRNPGKFFGETGNPVCRHDFSSGENRLTEADPGDENIVHVQVEGIVKLSSELVQCRTDVSLSQCSDYGLPERTLHVFSSGCRIRYDGLLEIAHEFVH